MELLNPCTGPTAATPHGRRHRRYVTGRRTERPSASSVPRAGQVLSSGQVSWIFWAVQLLTARLSVLLSDIAIQVPVHV